jgi:tetratricopeptide (TPR) repeat protein
VLADWYSHGAAAAQIARRSALALWYLDRQIAARPDEWRPYVDRAELYAQLGKTGEYDADLERAVARGANQSLMLRVADEQARRGQWQKAADYFQKAAKRSPLPVGVVHEHAPVRLQLGDLAAYRQMCKSLVDSAGKAPSAGLANAISWICALGPGAVGDYAPVVALAERAMKEAGSEPARRHDVLNTLGAVLCHAGRCKEALARLQEGIDVDYGKAVPSDWLFQALCHDGLGDKAAARDCLAKVPPPPMSEKNRSWADIEIDVLRREVAALLKER